LNIFTGCNQEFGFIGRFLLMLISLERVSRLAHFWLLHDLLNRILMSLLFYLEESSVDRYLGH